MILGRKFVASVLAFAVATGPSAVVLAGPSLLNGNFLLDSGGNTITTGGYLGNGSTTLQAWTTSGYNFVYTAANPNQSVAGVAMTGVTYSGLPTSYAGNYVAADGNFAVGPIDQTIGGLTANQSYNVSFYWAVSQQAGFTPPINAGWEVNLGTDASTAQLTGNKTFTGTFTGWTQETFTFQATSASEVLSFLATTTSSGAPPFALLADVSLSSPSAVPEPGSLILVGLGVIGIGVARLVRRKQPVGS
jgi:hypothetical protein